MVSKEELRQGTLKTIRKFMAHIRSGEIRVKEMYVESRSDGNCSFLIEYELTQLQGEQDE